MYAYVYVNIYRMFQSLTVIRRIVVGPVVAKPVLIQTFLFNSFSADPIKIFTVVINAAVWQDGVFVNFFWHLHPCLTLAPQSGKIERL